MRPKRLMSKNKNMNHFLVPSRKTAAKLNCKSYEWQTGKIPILIVVLCQSGVRRSEVTAGNKVAAGERLHKSSSKLLTLISVTRLQPQKVKTSTK
ncbi:uncharacterized protein V6R79_019455 [Siganus canaliculatus]